ncbi:MAG: phosphoribosylanthranilate isomerase [Alphaproteobacteria bacterium]|nr:phosphoribosylanthranilate isomerase [Alphaproteobacteria bacterium]
MEETKIKICGLSEPKAITAAIEEGTDFVGFVFFSPSPRYVDIEKARYLCSYLPEHVTAVGLFVNPLDQDLEVVLNQVPLGMIQLHGDESSGRIEAVKERFNLPVIKALPIATKEDLSRASIYDGIADWLLFDAKGETLPGGNGQNFDWSILKDYSGQSPWMLAGGLTPENVTQAIHQINPYGLDVSSGVESSSGVKDAQKIRSFIQAVKKA